MKPIIALNLKSYKESLGKGALEMCQIASEVSLLTGVRIIVSPQHVDLREAVQVHSEIFAQHTDPHLEGPHTGAVAVESIKAAGCIGSLLNHSEHRVEEQMIAQTLNLLKEASLECILCTRDTAESVRLARYEPAYIAVEPPELIGKGISVSTARPELVSETVEAVAKVNSTRVLCGAGVSNGADVKRAIELGAQGVLLASAFVKSPDPKSLLMEMATSL